MSNYKPPMMSIMNCHHIQSILTVSGYGIKATREDYTYCGEETWEEEEENQVKEVKGWTEIWQ